VGELTDAGEKGFRRGRNRGLDEGEEKIGGDGGDGGWRKKKERKQEEGEGWWAGPFNTQEVCGVPSRPTRSEYRRTRIEEDPGSARYRIICLESARRSSLVDQMARWALLACWATSPGESTGIQSREVLYPAQSGVLLSRRTP
jgi:hypothetical protein